eukprot:149620-Chlamydomonas_euryale.AAC.1
MAVENPLSAAYKIGYSLAVATSADCINACSGHGDCSDDGVCACKVRVAVGLGCGVQTSQGGRSSRGGG